ncbi:flagellar motor switch phosphatase FliY [Bacillus sp. FJAT-45350]|uniref:flagellar motor switch phosphatase FliY n=1 Tax=Bacillus sp. FJAT-45350 TaxID=2011014 RepID=UPI000BB7A578|nr:flagellar motor switch phosphatase FliY [Bacillus sp. FJAT-45350]
MNDDMLSQEEINQLLQGIGSDDDDDNEVEDNEDSSGGPSLNVEDYISPIEQDALGEIGNISFGSAATALSTLLNQKVDITTPQVSIIERRLLEDEFPQPHVAVHVEYTEGFEGMNLLVIKTTDAAIIADLMLGGDGLNPSDDLGEMQVSAVQEAMNQMMGSASTSMSTIFNKKVDISPPGIDLMDVKRKEGTSNIPSDEVLVKISFRLKIGELIDSSIMQLVTVRFAKGLVDELMNPSTEESVFEEPKVEEPTQPAVQQPQQEQAMQQQDQYQQPPMQQPMNHQQPPMQQQPMYQQPPMQQPMYEQRGQQHLGAPYQQQRQVDVQPAAFSSFDSPDLSVSESRNLNMLLDIPLNVTVELGRTRRTIKDILEFSQGSIIELDKLAGEPVDILVNHKLIAKGEVVVIDENFGVRVTDIVSQEERIKHLKK